MILYDKKNNRLVSIDSEATPEFWDKRWEAGDFIKYVTDSKHMSRHDRRLKYCVDKYLSPGAKILEGGCGRGRYVYGFSSWGYDAYGVDFAENTIKMINHHFPQLKVSKQDVRNLEFEDDSFDCYLSGGVIEHFWDGYNDIIKETHRVLKSKGYLIITIPFFSYLRRLKAHLGVYESFISSNEPDNYYQFFLDHKQVIRNIEQIGFRNVEVMPYNVFLGLEKEFKFLAPALQNIELCKNPVTRNLTIFLRKSLKYFSSHTVLMIFQKD